MKETRLPHGGQILTTKRGIRDFCRNNVESLACDALVFCIAAGPDLESGNAGNIEKSNELEHQRRAPDDPNHGIAQLAQRGKIAHGAKGHHQPQRQRKQQCQKKDLDRGAQTVEQSQ